MIITALARLSLEYYLRSGKVLPVPYGLPAELGRRAGAFVSLHEADGSLRGCIGTTQAAEANVAAEVIANAVSAAAHDPRFAPVSLAELDGLKISVDVLTSSVPEPDQSQLDPAVFGVVVSAGDGRQGVLLPALPDVTSAAEQIAICREKGGIRPDEPVSISKFQVKRYEEELTAVKP